MKTAMIIGIAIIMMLMITIQTADTAAVCRIVTGMCQAVGQDGRPVMGRVTAVAGVRG